MTGPTKNEIAAEAVEEGRRGIERSGATYSRPWHSPPSPYELSKASVLAAQPIIEARTLERVERVLLHNKLVEMICQTPEAGAGMPEAVIAVLETCLAILDKPEEHG